MFSRFKEEKEMSFRIMFINWAPVFESFDMNVFDLL